MCVNYVNMVPIYCNVVARQGCNATISCAKCRALMTAEKQVDFGDLWRSRHAMPVANNNNNNHKNHDNNGFKIWRKPHISSSKSSPKDSTKNQENLKIEQQNQEMNLLKFLAINALELTAPASPILLHSRSALSNSPNSQNQNNWFQLSGHPDTLAPAGLGTVWKKRAPQTDDSERMAYEKLSADPVMRDVIPKYYREVQYNGDTFIEMQDLLYGFQDPYVMDIKMGTRTFLESEVQKSTARNDLYEKMISINPNAPTEEEHFLKAVTKLRYMQFREKQSSSASLGFRIEALKIRGKKPVKDLKTVKTQNEVKSTLQNFMENTSKLSKNEIKKKLISRLDEIRIKVEQSEFFKNHEIVGSSLFIIFDDNKLGVWLIDFAKTVKVPLDINLDHRKPWVKGNHEEGFLFGLDKLISIIEEIDFQETTNFDKENFQKSVNTISVQS